MVSNVRLYHVHQRLCEIFGVTFDKTFAGLTMIVVDLYQLPPIRHSYVFQQYKVAMLNMCHPWNEFKVYELTETMRQQGDTLFVELLYNIREGRSTPTDLSILETRKVEKQCFPEDAAYVFAENVLKDQHNSLKLAELQQLQITIFAIDKTQPMSVLVKFHSLIVAKPKLED